MSDVSNSASSATGEISRLTDHLFRREAGKLISVLTGSSGSFGCSWLRTSFRNRSSGTLRTWPYIGVPKNPADWLTQTAKNLALDVIRREKLFHGKEPQIIAFMEQWPSESVVGESPMFWLCARRRLRTNGRAGRLQFCHTGGMGE
jgi:hypothetical protein